jgi:hypothetical protein
MAGAPTELATSLLQKIDTLPEDHQELFYHAEPLDVAKDLSGIERWSDEQVRAYIEQSRRETNTDHDLGVMLRRFETELSRERLLVEVEQTWKEPTQGEIQSRELVRIVRDIGKMEAEKRYTRLGLLIAEIVGVAGLAISIALAVTSLIAVIPAIIFSTLTSIITVLLLIVSPKWLKTSIRDGKPISKSSK